jgi:hypothetical protein
MPRRADFPNDAAYREALTKQRERRNAKRVAARKEHATRPPRGAKAKPAPAAPAAPISSSPPVIVAPSGVPLSERISPEVKAKLQASAAKARAVRLEQLAAAKATLGTAPSAPVNGKGGKHSQVVAAPPAPSAQLRHALLALEAPTGTRQRFSAYRDDVITLVRTLSDDVSAAFPTPQHHDVIAACWAAGLGHADCVRRLGVIRFSLADAMPSARLGLASGADDALAAVRDLTERAYASKLLKRVAASGEGVPADRNLGTVAMLVRNRVVTVESRQGGGTPRIMLTGLGVALARDAKYPLHRVYGGDLNG